MKIAVIGGGASGLMAAVAAARRGSEVTVFEKLNKIGKKILATGNGRCNYTNLNVCTERYHGGNLKTAQNVMDYFNVSKTLEFFEDLGIYPYEGELGKIYPNSLQSSSVLDVLMYEINRLNVEIITDCEIKSLRKNKDKFIIMGNGTYEADKVIISTGGKAAPQLGSDGGGYALAEYFGHKIIEPFPALVQLKLKGKYFKKIAGTRFDGTVKGIANNKVIREDEGEILFTQYGISGPPVLQISRGIIEELNKNNSVCVAIDMYPDKTNIDLYEILSKRFRNIGYKSIEDGLVGFLNKRLISAVLAEAGFSDFNKQCGKLNKKEIFKIIDVLKEWKFEVTGHNTWEQAQTTAGGVDLKEFNPNTLESYKAKGLFMCGEVLDVDGDCGGFNLQWAWSSGYTAGHFSSIS